MGEHLPNDPMGDPPIPKRRRSADSHFNFNSHLDSSGIHSLLTSLGGFSTAHLDSYLSRLVQSNISAWEKGDAIDGVLVVGSALLELGKRASRRLAAQHNTRVWNLPSEFTIKIFSLLDTHSLCQAAASCTLFHTWAKDPKCYAHIDLVDVTIGVNDLIVSTLIQRAGSRLQSLKLGFSSRPPRFYLGNRSGRRIYTRFTASCLAPLSDNGGIRGSNIRTLHLIHMRHLTKTSLHEALSVCTSLRELELVGLQSCPLIEHLCLQDKTAGVLHASIIAADINKFEMEAWSKLKTCCPNISSLALRGYGLSDEDVFEAVQGLPLLNSVDFSLTFSISGSFLGMFCGTAFAKRLKVVILRQCVNFKKVEAERFFRNVLDGEFPQLKHIDISSEYGLAGSSELVERSFNLSLDPSLRSRLYMLSEFPKTEEDQRRARSRLFTVDEDMFNIELGLSSPSH